MPPLLQISKPSPTLEGEIVLDGSKSLSNRALIILSLAGSDPADWLSNLSGSSDTRILQRLLKQSGTDFDTGDAGAAFRFLTAWLALQPGEQTLTGSARMLERPVGALVDALRTLGADIRYLGREAYPPLRIGESDIRGGKITVNAGVSSQFLSALLMVAPNFEEGLLLEPQGRLVSQPYVNMTLKMMRYFGADADWENGNIRVAPGAYQPRNFVVEADWSAASYWYAMAGLAKSADISLRGLSGGHLQGDRVLTEIGARFGIETGFYDGGINLKYRGAKTPEKFAWDFTGCPDIAQSIAVLCAGRGIPALFDGLETLTIKETDRTLALQKELQKVGVHFAPADPEIPAAGQQFTLSGKASWKSMPHFATYGDHRMAMSFAPLGLLDPVAIENPAVVNKSYPRFWEHLAAVGFEMEAVR